MANARSFTGSEARGLLRRARTGTLATLNHDGGIPYASLANIATDLEGRPLIFVSTLAWHTRNLLADPRASLLVAETPAAGDALTGARVTVMGRFEKVSGHAARRRYLARHPAANMYVDFGDFAFWRLLPEKVHAVAGFGRIETMEADEVFTSGSEWADLEESAIAHMNEDHAEAVQLYAIRLLGGPAGDWRVAAIDCDGCDLLAGDVALWLPFDSQVSGASDLRLAFAALSDKARKA